MKLSLTATAILFAIFDTVASAPPYSNETTLKARQVRCDMYAKRTKLVGDGNPHQVFLNKQISLNMNCGTADACSQGQNTDTSFTVKFDAAGTIHQWIDGGFSVDESYKTSDQITCAGATGDDVCVWQRIAHTAYTVQNYNHNMCTGAHPEGDPVVITSPNKVQTNEYCVVGACRSPGDAYWEDTSIPGGPPS